MQNKMVKIKAVISEATKNEHEDLMNDLLCALKIWRNE